MADFSCSLQLIGGRGLLYLKSQGWELTKRQAMESGCYRPLFWWAWRNVQGEGKLEGDKVKIGQ